MVKLSIVIPYYKTYNLTVKLLDKLCMQLTDEVEVFLVDDGCQETKLDYYKSKINVIHLDKNVGGASAMNVALKKTEGQYIAIIDSDDMITDDYIEILIEVINERNEDVIFFDWQDMNTGEIVMHPCNYAPWKAIYKKEIMPLFREGWIYSYDVPFQVDLDKTNYTRYYLGRVLYLYNSNREGSLTLQKEEIRRKEMIKCEVVKPFTLGEIDKIKIISKKSDSNSNLLSVGDIFECNAEMVDYLTKTNARRDCFVKVIEVRPDEVEHKIKEVKKTIKKKK